MNNGGFHAFFRNSSGLFVHETVQALAEIGATITKALLENAILVGYPNGFPIDSSRHQIELLDVDDVEDELAPLDAAFWQYHEPLQAMINEYLAKKY